MSVGYIYVMTNSAMPGLVKIGLTRNEVARRARELASTGVPTPFQVDYYCLTSDVEQVEERIHALFDEKRARGKEFFAVGIREAVLAIDEAVRPVVPERFCRMPEEELHPTRLRRRTRLSGTSPEPDAGTLKLPVGVSAMRGNRRYDEIIRIFRQARQVKASLRLGAVSDKSLWEGLRAASQRVGEGEVEVTWVIGGMVGLSKQRRSRTP